MNRRDFLKLTLYSSAMAGVGMPFGVRANHDAGMAHTLVNVMCLGGADFRYMLAPNPADTEYATKYWEARQALFNTGGANYATYQEVWDDLYSLTDDGSANGFGIHNNAGWLKTQFDNNNVAIICNVAGSENRRHDHSQLIVNTGDLAASEFIYDRDGWGGRLAEAIGAANVVSMSNDISVFCKGTDSANRLDQVIHARDTRNFALSEGTNDVQQRMARALKNYYLSKRDEVVTQPADWPYHKFIQHENAVRAFGDPFRALMDANPLPPSLANLTLNESGFAQQCSNVYDSFTGADLFQLRVASMEYSGWDTHSTQKPAFENNIVDVFGTGQGLDTLTSELSAQQLNNTVFVFTTDFGRQLRANGDSGTDHGSGNYMFLVGPPVNGGVYGEIFPRSEISTDTGPARYDIQGADITGLTSFERVLAEACDWVEPGTGVQVFPNTAFNDLVTYPDGPILENGVDLTTLFT